ncbi:MAG: RHS repeat domain-containing protein, partial [Allomuricauda sp.]
QGHGRVSFEYGILMNRTTAYYGGEQSDVTQRRYEKHYSAIIPAEIVKDNQTGDVKIITYVGGDAYSAPIAHIKNNTVDEYHYLHRDYLGSIMAITDADGDVKEELQFGAWGTVDKFLDSSGGTTFGHGSLLGRGYTGHEHFFEVGLIHMNGRMYDPQLGRFLSPDNFIQDAFNTQSYNRYGYVMNSPLMYTDPSGEIWEWVVAGAIILLASAGLNIDNSWFDGGSAYTYGAPVQEAPVPKSNPGNSNIASSTSNNGPRLSQGNGPLSNIYWNGYTDGFKGVFTKTWNGIKEIFTDPMAVIKRDLNRTLGQRVQGSLLQTWDIIMPGMRRMLEYQTQTIMAAQTGDVYKLGYVSGELHGEGTMEVATAVTGGVAGRIVKGLSAIARGIGSAANRGFNRIFNRLARNTTNRIDNPYRLVKYKKVDPNSSAGHKSLDIKDSNHYFSNIVDNYMSQASKWTIKGTDGVHRSLYQLKGSLRGQNGIFEWIVESGGNVTHRVFIPNGKLTGIPNVWK